jgi:hypothetical protein
MKLFILSFLLPLCHRLDGISQHPIDQRQRFQFWVWALKRKILPTVEIEDSVGFYLRSSLTITCPLPLELMVAASHIEDSNEANCLSSGQLGEIMRDIGRTFPQHPIFARNCPGELMLANILKAIVSLRPDIGYCQVPPVSSPSTHGLPGNEFCGWCPLVGSPSL